MFVFQRYNDAEEAMEQVLKLDQNCKEASSKLFSCRVLQLMVRGTRDGKARLPAKIMKSS